RRRTRAIIRPHGVQRSIISYRQARRLRVVNVAADAHHHVVRHLNRCAPTRAARGASRVEHAIGTLRMWTFLPHNVNGAVCSPHDVRSGCLPHGAMARDLVLAPCFAAIRAANHHDVLLVKLVIANRYPHLPCIPGGDVVEKAVMVAVESHGWLRPGGAPVYTPAEERLIPAR